MVYLLLSARHRGVHALQFAVDVVFTGSALGSLWLASLLTGAGQCGYPDNDIAEVF